MEQPVKDAKTNWCKMATLIFMLASVLHLLFLVLLRHDLKPSGLLFLLTALAMTSAIIYQIFKQKKRPGSEKIILFEIFVFSLLLHFFYVIPCTAGAFGDDFPQYFYATRLFMNHGYIIPADVLASPEYEGIRNVIKAVAYHPSLLMNGGLTSLITGVDLITICRWLPSVWTAIGTMVVYLVGKSMFSDRRTALLAALAYSTISWSISFHTQYAREGLALLVLLFALYTFHSSYFRQRGANFTVLAILFSVILILTHYYVSAIWLVLLAVFAFCSVLVDYLVRRTRFFNNKSVWPSGNTFWRFIAIIVTLTFAYWMYVEVTIMPHLFGLTRTVVRYGIPTIPFSPIVSPSVMEILLSNIGRWVYLGIYLCLLVEVIRGFLKACPYLKEDLFVGLWVFLLVIALPYLFLLGGPRLYPQRVTIFALPFITMGAAHFGANIGRWQVRNITISLIVIYIILNLFRLPGVPANLLDPVQRETAKDNYFVYTTYRLPQDPQGIAAMDFYQRTDDTVFTRWFTVGNREVFTEAYEVEGGTRLYEFKLYTTHYAIIAPDSHGNKDMIYNNGEVEIYR